MSAGSLPRAQEQLEALVSRVNRTRTWVALYLAGMLALVVALYPFVSSLPQVRAQVATPLVFTQAAFASPQLAAYGPARGQGLDVLVTNAADQERSYTWRAVSSTGRQLASGTLPVPAGKTVTVRMPLKGSKPGERVEFRIDGWTGLLRTGEVK